MFFCLFSFLEVRGRFDELLLTNGQDAFVSMFICLRPAPLAWEPEPVSGREQQLAMQIPQGICGIAE